MMKSLRYGGHLTESPIRSEIRNWPSGETIRYRIYSRGVIDKKVPKDSIIPEIKELEKKNLTGEVLTGTIIGPEVLAK